MEDASLPKPVARLVESLHHYTDLVEQQPSFGTGEIEILDYPSAEMGPHTETLYVPDLMQGEFQPLEELDDEVLSQMVSTLLFPKS